MRDARPRGPRPARARAAVAAALAALFAGALAARADGVSVVVTPSFVSQYMFRGSRLGGFSFEPSVEVDMGNGALGIWSNFPLMDKVDGVSDPEIDPYGSYTIAISSSVSLVPGFTVYTYPNANTRDGSYRSTFEPSLAATYTVAGLVLTPKVYYDLVLEGPTFELNAAYSVPLKAVGTSLAFAATAGTYEWDNAANGAVPRLRNWGDYWQLGLALPFALSKQSTLTIGYAYAKGADSFYRQGAAPRYRNDAAVGRGVASVAYARTF